MARKRSKSYPYTPVKTPTSGNRIPRQRGGSASSKSSRGASKAALVQMLRAGGVAAGARALASASPAVRSAFILGRTAYRGVKTARRLYQQYNSLPGSPRGKRGGASMSKSKGFFVVNSTKNNILSKYQNSGIVFHKEHGHVVTDAVNQAVYIGHSTCPKRTIIRGAFCAMIKTLCRKAGIKIKNLDEAILKNSNIPARIAIHFKEVDGSTVSIQEFTLSVTKTLLQLESDIVTWLETFTATTFPQIFLRMVYYHDVGVIGSSRLISYDIDLTNTWLDVYATSCLKVQNRTINSTGNNEADDVDNVPLYGRIFEMNYNGTIFRDYNQPPLSPASSPQLRTDIDLGSLTTDVSSEMKLSSSLYNEVAQPQQLIGCYSHGKVHLDPGEIKTSKLVFNKKIGMNKLITLYKSKVGFNGRPEFYFGKTRIIGVEKMISAVAMNETNAFNLAFEHDLKVGFICTTIDNHQTAVKTEAYNGPISV